MATFQTPNRVLPGKNATGVAIAAFKAVKADSTENLVVIAGAGDDITGFSADAIAADAVAEINGAGGGALATAGGNISDGERLKVDANGDLVLAASAGDFSVAVARADAVDNDVFPVYVEALRIHA